MTKLTKLGWLWIALIFTILIIPNALAQLQIGVIIPEGKPKIKCQFRPIL